MVSLKNWIWVHVAAPRRTSTLPKPSTLNLCTRIGATKKGGSLGTQERYPFLQFRGTPSDKGVHYFGKSPPANILRVGGGGVLTVGPLDLLKERFLFLFVFFWGGGGGCSCSFWRARWLPCVVGGFRVLMGGGGGGEGGGEGRDGERGRWGTTTSFLWPKHCIRSVFAPFAQGCGTRHAIPSVHAFRDHAPNPGIYSVLAALCNILHKDVEQDHMPQASMPLATMPRKLNWSQRLCFSTGCWLRT